MAIKWFMTHKLGKLVEQFRITHPNTNKKTVIYEIARLVRYKLK